jgi:hypothetical protein
LHNLTITAKANHDEPKSYPKPFSPLSVFGLDQSGNSPLFLGTLTDGFPDYKISHIICKMPGYSWYYNQYNGMQYEPTHVQIYPVHDYELKDDIWTFHTDMPWSYQWQEARKKK